MSEARIWVGAQPSCGAGGRAVPTSQACGAHLPAPAEQLYEGFDLGGLLVGSLPSSWSANYDNVPAMAPAEAPAEHGLAPLDAAGLLPLPPQPPQPKPKQRLRWTPQLHVQFLQACNALGGPEAATPKQILLHMDVAGLSLFHVKSHLQKYRIAIKGGTEGQLGRKRGSKRGRGRKPPVQESESDEQECDSMDEGEWDGVVELQKRVRIAHNAAVSGAGAGPSGPADPGSCAAQPLLLPQPCPAPDALPELDHEQQQAASGVEEATQVPSCSAGDDTSCGGSAGTLTTFQQQQQQQAETVAGEQHMPGLYSSKAAASTLSPPHAQLEPSTATEAHCAEAASGAAGSSSQPCLAKAALVMQMDLQRQLQEALEAQRQLQLKLLEHGQFIQLLMKNKNENDKVQDELPCPAAAGGELGAAPGSSEPLPKHRSAQDSSSGGSGNGEGDGSRSVVVKKALPAKQGGRAGGKAITAAKSSSGVRGLQRVSSGNSRSRGGSVHTTTHLILAPGQDHLAALGSSSSLAAQPYAALQPMPAPQPHQQQQEAAQPLQPLPQPQAAVPAFRVDPAVVLARLAHGMPICEMELTALLGPDSHLTPTQKEHVRWAARQQGLVYGQQHAAQQLTAEVSSGAEAGGAASALPDPSFSAHGWAANNCQQSSWQQHTEQGQQPSSSLQAATTAVCYTAGSQSICSPSIGTALPPLPPRPQRQQEQQRAGRSTAGGAQKLPNAPLCLWSGEAPAAAELSNDDMLCMLTHQDIAGPAGAAHGQHAALLGGRQSSCATAAMDFLDAPNMLEELLGADFL